jgi:bacillopeptidase F
MKNKVLLMIVVPLVALLVAACAPTTTPTVTSTPPAGLFLKVSEPLDESVVTASPVGVSGTTIPNAVVSVNGEIVEVDEQGNFTTMVTLEEGPNIIEVIASDLEGNEVSTILAIIYSALPTTTPTPPVVEELFLDVMEPQDESTITINSVGVSGTTIPNAVVSINGEIAEVDEQGNFTTMVTLEEGPNIIEVIASDLEGNEVSKSLVIFYIP